MNDEQFYKRHIPNPGEKWQYFNGNIYKIICIAEDSERVDPVIVYQGIHDFAYWVLPLGKFMSAVDHEQHPDVTQEYCFEKVADGIAKNP
ncbi:DUF1653 domain-containing protein [Megasphaera sp. WILCCON 0056]|uniref:DUF1653 domain-containing protein n=1 Tax=Megasphaera sp. WILCCON 0056 TaxID=3345340 RepID=UPI003A809A81